MSTKWAKQFAQANGIDESMLNAELEKMYTLSRMGKIHTEQRQMSIKSHIRDVSGIFSTFSYEEFYNYVYQNYMKAMFRGKKLSRSYLQSKVNTIKRLSKTRYFGRRDIARIVCNLDKLMNPMAKTNEFYTSTGHKIQLDKDTIRRIRGANVVRLEQQEPLRKEGDLIVSHLYSDVDCEFLVQHFTQHLENYLKQENNVLPTVYDELSLIVVFMFHSPRRVNEILQLTYKQYEDLITQQMTKIQSKSNIRPTKLLIPVILSGYLQSFIGEHADLKSNASKLVIKHSYQQLLKALKQITATLLNRRVERPFHGFRNYFAGKFKSSDYKNTRRALDHASGRVTNMYACKQRKQYGISETLNFLNNCHQ